MSVVLFRSYNSISLPSMVRRNFCNQNCPDAQLNFSFQGVMPKLVALGRKLITMRGLSEYMSLYNKGVITSTLAGLHLFAYLQNPLLVKYGFDASIFHIGAMKAFDMVGKIINGQDFIKYSLGELEDEPDECARLLKHAIDTETYCLLLNFKRKTTLERKKMIQFDSLENDSNIQSNFKVLDMLIDSVATRVVKSVSPDSASGYPVGSVVAAVDTFFAVEESLTLTGKATSASTDRASGFIPIIRDTLEHSAYRDDGMKFMRITFESCISGQVACDWKIRGWTIAMKEIPFSYKILTFTS